MEFLDRPIAITDVETTGWSPVKMTPEGPRYWHEIIDLGMVLVDQRNFDIRDRVDLKVRPEHPERGDETNPWKPNTANQFTGYNEEEWKDAVTLKEAMEVYARKTKGAMFCAHNVVFDWGFIEAAFAKTGVGDHMDYHRIDLYTLAFTKLKDSGLTKFNMNEIAKFLGITPEPDPHRAINGAMTEYEILKKLWR